jgi:cell division protein FtsB
MRLLTVSLLTVLVLLQAPLWFGRGGWLKVHALDSDVDAQRKVNDERRTRNAALDAEVRDLKQGYDAIEERARADLGMVRRDEVFYQVLDTERPTSGRAGEGESAGASPSPTAASPKPADDPR